MARAWAQGYVALPPMDWHTFGVSAAVGYLVVLLTGLTRFTGLRNLKNPVNPVQTAFAAKMVSNWNVRGAWRDWQGVVGNAERSTAMLGNSRCGNQPR